MHTEAVYLHRASFYSGFYTKRYTPASLAFATSVPLQPYEVELGYANCEPRAS